MIEPHNWVPQNAIFDGKISNVLGEVLSNWSKKWFENKSYIGENVTFVASGPEIVKDDHIWETSDKALVAVLRKENRNLLAEALIGKPVPEQKVSNADRAVIDKLITACLDDLQSSLIDTLETEDEFEEFLVEKATQAYDNLNYCMNTKFDNENEILQIWMTEDLIATIRKKLVAERVDSGDLGSLHQAVSRQSVLIGARVGFSKVGISEIKNLSLGDVIVLDNELGGAMELTLNNRRVSSMFCRVIQDKDPNLKLTQIGTSNT